MTQAKPYWTQAALALALLHLAGTAPAQPANPSARPAPLVTAQTIEQKSAMLDRVLNHSPAWPRIACTSQNEHARKHFATARELLSHARDLAADGALRGADGLLNEAIYEVSRAQQLVPDPGSQAGRARPLCAAGRQRGGAAARR